MLENSLKWSFFKTYYALFSLAQQQLEGELNKLLAIEAPLYQLYQVNILNKVRAKSEISLGKLWTAFIVTFFVLLVVDYRW